MFWLWERPSLGNCRLAGGLSCVRFHAQVAGQNQVSRSSSTCNWPLCAVRTQNSIRLVLIWLCTHATGKDIASCATEHASRQAHHANQAYIFGGRPSRHAHIYTLRCSLQDPNTPPIDPNIPRILGAGEKWQAATSLFAAQPQMITEIQGRSLSVLLLFL